MARKRNEASILVVGLGRFGRATADQLMDLGHEVLAIEPDATIVADAAPFLTLVVEGDATHEETLRQLGVADFTHAIVAIGEDVEASILATSLLADLGVPVIWAKARTPQHGRILQRVGATHVVFPEHEMGRRVAHLITGRMSEYMDFPDGYAISMVPTPPDCAGRTLGDSALRSRFGVTVVGVRTPGEPVRYATAETRLGPQDMLVVAGNTEDVDRFTAET